ncbi:MAG: tetratricopeptide repeat protein [Vampirovibrionales bacterium]
MPRTPLPLAQVTSRTRSVRSFGMGKKAQSWGLSPRHWRTALSRLGPLGQVVLTVVGALLLSGSLFSGLLVFRSSDQDDLMAMGQRDLAEGRAARAVKVLSQLVRNNPRHLEGHLALVKAYLTIGDMDAAQKEFSLAAGLKPDSLKVLSASHDAVAIRLAQSQLALANNEFDLAAEPLTLLLSQSEKQMSSADRSEVQAMLTDVHQQWADSILSQSIPTAQADSSQDNKLINQQSQHLSAAQRYQRLKEAIEHYQKALQTVQTYAREKALKQKLLALIEQWLESQPSSVASVASAEHEDSQAHSAKARRDTDDMSQSPQEAINLLQSIIRWLPEPGLMIRMGDLYLLQAASFVGQPDQHNALMTHYQHAIHWYRKAYNLVPHGVGVKLSQALLLRGKAFLKAGEETKAAADFREADLLQGRSAGDPALSTPALLYPIAVDVLRVAPNLNRETQLFQPHIAVVVASKARRPLKNLQGRIQVLVDGKLQQEWIKALATPKAPLTAEGTPHSKVSWSASLKTPLPVSLLTHGGSVRVTMAVAYGATDEDNAPLQWDVKRVQDIRLQPKKPATSQQSAPPVPGVVSPEAPPEQKPSV